MKEEYGISFLKDFKCAASECPKTCCRGWQILLDRDAIKAVEKKPKEERTRYLKNIAKKGTDTPRIRKRLGRCPYFTVDARCELQEKGEEDVMPRVCREYPRRILDFGSFQEITMELACPVAAGLFLDQCQEISMEPWRGPHRESLWHMGNEDAEFLEFLRQLRQKTIAVIRDAESFDTALMQRIYRQYCRIHDALMRDHREEAWDCLEQMDGMMEGKTCDVVSAAVFFSMETVDKVIAHQLDHGSLGLPNDELKRRIRRYYRYFNGKTGKEAERIFCKIWEEMEQKMPGTKERYRAYYIYYLYEMLLSAYEDYHLLKVILLGNMYLELYMVMDGVTWLMCRDKGIPYTKELRAETLASLERRMRHDPNVTKGILEQVRKDFLKKES